MNPSTRRIKIYSLGGTITGLAEHASDVLDYKPGALHPKSILRKFKHDIPKNIHITLVEYARTGSPDLKQSQLLQLARQINNEGRSKENRVDAFVIWLGTDAAEEIAFLLRNIIDPQLLVVLSGAYRPASSLSADGERNGYTSILVAADDSSKGRGILWTTNDQIFSGCYIEKKHANRIGGINAGDFGELGYISDHILTYHFGPSLPTDPRVSINLDLVQDLPRVEIVTCHLGWTAEHFLCVAKLPNVRGMVFEGQGAGCCSTDAGQEIVEHIMRTNLFVVDCFGTERGHVGVSPVYGLGNACIAGGNLGAKKARIKLQLLLHNGANLEQARQAFRAELVGVRL